MSGKLEPETNSDDRKTGTREQPGSLGTERQEGTRSKKQKTEQKATEKKREKQEGAITMDGMLLVLVVGSCSRLLL